MGRSQDYMGQVPTEEWGTMSSHLPIVTDPTVNEKSMPLAQTMELAPPPAYTPEDVSTPVSTAPTTMSETHLPKPIAIPSVSSAFDSPFLRSYPPSLAAYKLPKENFLMFLDALNAIVSSSPPLQVLDAAGGILKAVPILFPLRILGSLVSGIANLGSLGVNKGRTEVAMRKANKEIFGPRGLSIEIAKLDALAHVARMPILDSRGKVDKKSDVYKSLSRSGVGSCGEDGISQVDTAQRQLKTLQPFIAPLVVDVLPWTDKSKLYRFNAALKKRNGDLPDDAERQRRMRLLNGEYNDEMGKLAQKEEKKTGRGHGDEKLERKLTDIERERSKLKAAYEEERRMIDAEFGEGGFKSGLWLIIREL